MQGSDTPEHRVRWWAWEEAEADLLATTLEGPVIPSCTGSSSSCEVTGPNVRLSPATMWRCLLRCEPFLFFTGGESNASMSSRLCLLCWWSWPTFCKWRPSWEWQCQQLYLVLGWPSDPFQYCCSDGLCALLQNYHGHCFGPANPRHHWHHLLNFLKIHLDKELESLDPTSEAPPQEPRIAKLGSNSQDITNKT